MKPPIFIVGTMRSGTTLLRLILDSHENISIGPETGFMRAVKHMKSIPDFRYGEKWYKRYDFSETEINKRIRHFYRSIFESYATQQGKSRWGEKTPFHRYHMLEMATIFPRAVFIGMVRHPGAVAISLKKWNYDFGRSVLGWERSIKSMRSAAATIGEARYYQCRYEDLVLRPEPVLRKLMEFLKEPWSDSLMNHDKVQKAKGAPPTVEGGNRSDSPIVKDRIDSWLEMITDNEMLEMERCAGETVRALGYRLKSAVPVAEPALSVES